MKGAAMAWDWEPELSALAELDDQAAADAINAMTVTEYVPIESHVWLGWLGGDSRYLRLKQLAEDDDAEATARNVAIVALKLCDAPAASLRLDDTAHQAMLASVAAAVSATAEELAELQALGTRKVSKYREHVTDHQVAEARAQS